MKRCCGNSKGITPSETIFTGTIILECGMLLLLLEAAAVSSCRCQARLWQRTLYYAIHITASLTFNKPRDASVSVALEDHW